MDTTLLARNIHWARISPENHMTTVLLFLRADEFQLRTENHPGEFTWIAEDESVVRSHF